MAVHLDVRAFRELARPKSAEATTAAEPAEVERSFEARFHLAHRRRRLQRIQQGLSTAGWLGLSGLLLFLAVAGFAGLR